MTRDEMIERQMKATGFTRVACTGFIDQLAGAGIVKLDERKSFPQKLRDFVMDTRVVQGDAMQRLEGLHNALHDLGLQITEK